MSNRYFTKFCGITTVKDALNAQNCGCNAIGFVFVKNSKRYIDVRTCQKIIQKINPNILTVALFANNSKNEISEILNNCPVHVLQFHGSESKEFCSQWNKPYWKAIPMADDTNPIEYASIYDNAQAYLIDNFGSKKSGGSGKIFDWKNIPQDIDNKWILAGGLSVDNIQDAAKKTKMNAFDVSSGIEKSPGKKSLEKMRNFIKNLNLEN